MAEIIPMPVNLASLTPEQKIEYLEGRIRAIKSGAPNEIICPYCGVKNSEHEVYICCKLFADATSAILDRMEKQEAIDFFSNVSDKAMVN